MRYVFGEGGLLSIPANQATFIRQLVCNDDTPIPDTPNIPFSGGQCCGELYELGVEARIIYEDGEEQDVVVNPSVFRRLYGRIGGVEGRLTDSGYELVALHGSGQECEPVFETRLTGGSTPKPIISVVVDAVTVYPVDGTDDCGDPEPVPVPPNVNIYEGDQFTYTNNEGIDVTVPFGLVFAPVTVGVNNEISVPFTLDLGGDFPVELSGEYDLSNDEINYNFTNDSDEPIIDPSNGCDPIPEPDPEPIPDTDVDTDTDDDFEEGKKIRGVFVVSTVADVNATVVFQSDNPDIYTPRLANVSFLIEDGGRRGWTGDIPVRNKRQYIEVPSSLWAIDVGVTPLPGVSCTLYPAYVVTEMARPEPNS